MLWKWIKYFRLKHKFIFIGQNINNGQNIMFYLMLNATATVADRLYHLRRKIEANGGKLNRSRCGSTNRRPDREINRSRERVSWVEVINYPNIYSLSILAGSKLWHNNWHVIKCISKIFHQCSSIDFLGINIRLLLILSRIAFLSSQISH